MGDEKQDNAGVSRRSFLGLASLGAVLLSSLTVLAGVLRLTKPNNLKTRGFIYFPKMTGYMPYPVYARI